MQYVLALDQGTTSSRAIVFDRYGTIRGMAQREITQYYPAPAWVEHNPQEIWTTQLIVAQQALRNADVSAADLSAVGITNQRETTVLWDKKTGEPLANAIVWQDRRTADLCTQLSVHTERIRQLTGLVLDAYFSATKLAWLLDHVPGARVRAERGELAFGTIDTWLIWNLTGGQVHVTDTSNASRTMLFDIHQLAWSDELLGLFNIPASVLPQVVPSSAVLGHTLASHLGRAVPIAGVAGDQQAATFGQACHHTGMVKNTYGTGCFTLMNVGTSPVSSDQRLLSTVGWTCRTKADKLVTNYMLEGSVFMAGATVQWLRDNLGIIQSTEQVESLAASVEDTDGVYLVPAFTGLGAPYWDPHARGSLLGLSRGTSKAHIALAALESIAFQSAELIAAMGKDSGVALQILRVDGGASRNNLLMQFQADLLGVSVVRPKVTETTALGAAYLAGLATGLWSGLDEVYAMWQADRVFEPTMSLDQRQARLARWHKAVKHVQAWSAQD